MPLILFIFTIFLIFIFNKKIRGYLLSFIIIFSLIFFLAFKFNNKVRDNFLSFQVQIFNMIISLNEKNINQSNTPQIFKRIFNVL